MLSNFGVQEMAHGGRVETILGVALALSIQV